MRLYAAFHGDAHQGWVWLQDARFAPRCVIQITNPKSGKRVYCEALQIDNNFLEQYNQHPRVFITDPTSSLVIGGWLRAKLGGLQTRSDSTLVIKPCDSSWGKFRACIDHPQIVVRLATWLGVAGLVLGVFGTLLGVLSLA